MRDSSPWTVQRVLSSGSINEAAPSIGPITEDYFELFSEEELDELASEEAREFDFDSPACTRNIGTSLDVTPVMRQPIFDDVKPAVPWPVQPSMGTWLLPLPHKLEVQTTLLVAPELPSAV